VKDLRRTGAANTVSGTKVPIVMKQERTRPYTGDVPIVTAVTYVSGVLMKKSIATLIVAGALAVAGLSATSAITASSDNAGQGSVVAVGWWPNSTPKN
jgi:hypothetical protein